jgi:hypothetical protein
LREKFMETKDVWAFGRFAAPVVAVAGAPAARRLLSVLVLLLALPSIALALEREREACQPKLATSYEYGPPTRLLTMRATADQPSHGIRAKAGVEPNVRQLEPDGGLAAADRRTPRRDVNLRDDGADP